MLTSAIVIALAFGAIIAILLIALISQSFETRRQRRRATVAERAHIRSHAAERVREDRRRDTVATARATTRARQADDTSLAQHIATAPNVTALLPSSAAPDPGVTVELVRYRNPTTRELSAWRSGSRQV